MEKRNEEKGLSMLKKLRELDTGSIVEHYDKKNLEELKNYFKSEDYEKDEFLNELSFRLKEELIETEIKRIGDEFYEKDKNTLIEYLRRGKIYLTEFGKAYVEIFCYIKPDYENKTAELNNKIEELNKRTKDVNDNIEDVNKKIDKLEKIQNSLYFQVFTTMGIFVAIIGFITQGIKLITVEGYFNLCFFQQLKAGTALFLPLALIILLIFLCVRFVFPFNRKNKIKK